MAKLGVVKAVLEEPYTFYIYFLLVTLVGLTYDVKTGLIYGSLLTANYVMWQSLKTKLNFNSVSKNTLSSLVLAVASYAVFIGLSLVVINFLQGGDGLTTATINLRLQKAALGAATPLFENNPVVMFLVGTFVVTVIETKVLIANAMEFAGKLFNVSFNVLSPLKNPRLWVLFLAVSALGVVFHIQAKGVTDSVALILTFIFWMVSCFLITWRKESESAVYLHILNNGWVLLPLIMT